jgi:prophage regulatory protein
MPTAVQTNTKDQRIPAYSAVLRPSQLSSRLGLSVSSIYDRLDPKSPRHDPTFPRPISLGHRAVGFIESEVAAWIGARAAERVAA